MIIDFHTHAFPDAIAEKAIKKLEEGCSEKAVHNGTISALLKSMDESGIDKAVICSIATKPDQFGPILEWSKKIASDRIIPFCSVHPLDPDLKQRVKIISESGFKGIKVHPYYQNFSLDEERIFALYEAVLENDLVLVSHTGFDIAFDRIRIADPEKIKAVFENFPGIKFVSTHFGAWQDWEEVEKYLIGRNIYIEISYALEFMKKETAVRFINVHPKDYILFGTDSPWTDQKNTLSLLKDLELDKESLDKILYKNAEKILNS